MKTDNNKPAFFKDIKPDSLSDSEKKVLWSRISDKINNLPRAKSYMKPSLNVFFGRFVMRAIAMVLAVAVLMGGSAVAYASIDRSRPGDRLFPLDLAMEKVQITLSFGDKRGVPRYLHVSKRSGF